MTRLKPGATDNESCYVQTLHDMHNIHLIRSLKCTK